MGETEANTVLAPVFDNCVVGIVTKSADGTWLVVLTVARDHAETTTTNATNTSRITVWGLSFLLRSASSELAMLLCLGGFEIRLQNDGGGN